MISQKNIKLNKLTMAIGAVHDIYSRVSLYIGVANTLMMVLIFYNTVILPTPWLSWLSVPLFLLFGITSFFLIGVIVWKYLIPLLIAYANYQGYKHENLIKKDVAELKQTIEEIKHLVRGSDAR